LACTAPKRLQMRESRTAVRLSGEVCKSLTRKF
jgi:hypothetical protein